jgi:NAD+ diphosphatase
MTELSTYFSGNYINRFGEIRDDARALKDALANPATRFLPVFQERCLIRDNQPAFLTMAHIRHHLQNPGDAIFLGKLEGNFVFAIGINGENESDLGTDCVLAGLREITGQLDQADAALLAYAKAMVGWQNTHRHCGRCGAAARPGEGGFVMQCTAKGCGQRSFPRLDPAIIVLVHDGDRCLLGRQRRWPDGRFSTIAGFVEPGEGLEDGIRREVFEETNIRVGRCRYMASQPWPFPAALMIGFLAEALTRDIRLNDGELAEARWLTRDDIAHGAVVLPPQVSIAYRLLETWFDEGSDTSLASVDLPSPPLRNPG